MWLRVLSVVLVLVLAPISMPAEMDSDPSPLIENDDGPPLDVGAASSIDPVSRGFLENVGQHWDPEVHFYWQGDDLGIECLQDQVRMTLWEQDGSNRATISLTFEGARCVTPRGSGKLSHPTNFLLGPDASGWHVGVRSYSGIVYDSVYDGIDLVYRIQDGIPKYEFVLEPWADPSAISVHIQGHDDLRLTPEGDLEIMTSAGPLRDTELMVFQPDDRNQLVSASFSLISMESFGFNIGEYDPSRTLVIDPIMRSTYLGGEEYDIIFDVAVDDEMMAYVTGATSSGKFPVTRNAFCTTLPQDNNAFVSKLDLMTGNLIYSTFLGAGGYDRGDRIVVDGEGRAIIAGYTQSRDFPITGEAYCQSKPYDHGGFLCQLDADGAGLVFSTFLGGSSIDEVMSIILDSEGNIVVGGQTDSTDYPITPGAFRHVPVPGWSNAFVTKFAANGSSLIFSSVFGGSRGEEVNAMIYDDNGDLIITGNTNSDEFPTTLWAYKLENENGYLDAFVGRLSADGSTMRALTLFGGNWTEISNGVAIDENGEIIIGGITSSYDMPTTTDAIDREFNSTHYDGFLARLTPDLRHLNYSTYLGGNRSDEVHDLALNSTGCVFLSGETYSKDFPVTDDAYQDELTGESYDAFVMLVDIAASEVAYSTYLGGSSFESSTRMAVYGGEVVFLAGYCGSNDFPISSPTIQDSLLGRSDGFLAMFNFDSVVPVADAGIDIIARKNDMVQLNGSGSWDGVGVVNWSWFFGPAFDFEIQYGPNAYQIFTEPGVFPVTLEVFDRTSNFASDVIYVLVLEELEDTELEVGDMLNFGRYEYKDCPDAFQWTWTVDLNFTQRTVHGPFANFTFEYPGVYSVVRNVSVSPNNSFEDEMKVAVLGRTGSVADAGDDVVVDQGETVFLNGLATKMGIIEWEWTFTYDDESHILTGPVRVFTFNTSGTYEVTLRVLDIRNIDSFDTVMVTVLDITPPVAVAGDDMFIDQGRMVTLDGSMSTDNVGVVKWTFSFQNHGVDVVIHGPIGSFRFEYPGDYPVLLTVADAAGNMATDSMTVIVRDTVPPNALVLKDIAVGQKTTVRFEDENSTDNHGLARWTWSFTYGGEMVELTGQRVIYLFDIAGEYEVILTVTDGEGLSDSDQFLVIILDTTNPVADAGHDRSIEVGETIILDGANSTDNVGIVRWSWSFHDGDGYKRLDEQVTMYRFTFKGSYNVTLTVVDDEGNTATDTIVVTVKESSTEDGTAWTLYAIMAIILLVAVAMGLWAVSQRRKD